jgi:uncharacterized coiled-coil protein SlyX
MLVLLIIGMVVAACAAKSAVPTRVAEKASAAPATVAANAAKEAPRAAAPTPPPAVAPSTAGSAVATSVPDALRSAGLGAMPAESGRKIIKSGEMSLVVADTDKAIDDITLITVQRGGYVIGLDVAMQKDGFKTARISLGVPVNEFETMQRQVRGVALRVTKDNASGVDVTDTYVDTQSRLTNLEATQARIRQFLEQAKTVEESLKVNAQLAQIEAEIGQVQGRLNYLKDRSAYSTLIVDIAPERPTPTTTPTPTVTPTVTPSPTPTPRTWRPGETFGRATSAFTGLAIVVGDLGIWIIGFVLPMFSPILLLALLIWWRRRTAPPAPPPSAPPEEAPREEPQ